MDVSQHISVSGMLAHQRILDAIANDVANAGTVGFKRVAARTLDVGYRAGLTAPVGPNGEPVRLEGVGEGAYLADLSPDFAPGGIQPTGNPLDVALDGDGFLSVSTPDGTPAYTRDGAIHVDADNRLATAEGLPFRATDGGDIQLPSDATQVRIGEDGTVWTAGADGTEAAAGQLALTHFVNPQGLLAGGGSLWRESPESGPAVPAEPDAPGSTRVVAGALEPSNVQLAEDFTSLIRAQRGYELNLKMVQTWDDLAKTTNDIHS